MTNLLICTYVFNRVDSLVADLEFKLGPYINYIKMYVSPIEVNPFVHVHNTQAQVRKNMKSLVQDLLQHIILNDAPYSHAQKKLRPYNQIYNT